MVAFAATKEKSTSPPPFPKENIHAKAAYLINADNGEVLYAHNENQKLVPASLTKVMNLFVVNDALKTGKIKKSDQVTISEKAWRTGGSKMFLEVGTVYGVEDLIKGTAIVSGNDAAVSLAEHVAGSTDDFVKLMNEKAKSIGMSNTTFQTVNGLPIDGKKDLTTAKDLGTLANTYIKEYPDMLKIHSTKEYTTKTRINDIRQFNSNTLLESYKGMDGLKTGFADYYNFIGTAKQGKIRLIVVTLGSESNGDRMRTASSLLDYGFSQYKTYKAGKKGEHIDHLTVYKAKDIQEVDVELSQDTTYGINIRDEKRIKVENKLPDYVEGGLKKGDKVGKQIVTLDGKKLAESDLVITKDLPKANWFISIFHHIAMLFTQLLNKLGDLI